MKVLIACEYSGVARRAFEAQGCNVWSADFEPAEDGAANHYQGDCFDLIARQHFDLMIAHPPCTYLSVSGLHWNTRGRMVDGRPRAQLTEEALLFVKRLMEVPIKKKVIENPISCISSRIRKPDQIVQPYHFGDDASKATCLWLEGLQPLTLPPESEWFAPRLVTCKGRLVKRWGNQTDSGQNKLAPSDTRAKDRSRTYPGIAAAWAAQWSKGSIENFV